jgi:16S rRNA (cytosine1402-N4)-methyltransferase
MKDLARKRVKMSNKETPHIPVMLKESLQGFSGADLRVFFEGTVGAGGHAKAILEAHPEIHTYIGCDQDLEALAIAREVLKPWQKKVQLVHGNFGFLDEILSKRGIKKVDGFFLT